MGFIAVTAIVATIGGGTPLLAVAGVMIARTLPAFLFGPIAGTLVDRLDRKRLMIVADLARGAMYLSMVFLRELWAIYLLSFAIECLSLLWGRRATLRFRTSSLVVSSRTRTHSSC